MDFKGEPAYDGTKGIEDLVTKAFDGGSREKVDAGKKLQTLNLSTRYEKKRGWGKGKGDCGCQRCGRGGPIARVDDRGAMCLIQGEQVIGKGNSQGT